MKFFKDKQLPQIKLWIDDVRPAPNDDYVHICTTTDAIAYLVTHRKEICEVNLDHDAGDYAKHGGDYIEILRQLERWHKIYDKDYSHITFKFHSMNPVGVANMKAICDANGWHY